MQIFGLTITRTKAVQPHTKAVPAGYVATQPGGWGWWPVVREAFAGAWQRNIQIDTVNVLTFAAVYACVQLIASNIAKMRMTLVEHDANGIWNEVENSAYSPVLRKPNHYQTRIEFYEQWLVSKLVHGNTYVLKGRDQRGVVNAEYVLDPTRVRPLVTPDGQVFYSLATDNLSGVDGEKTIVPASEIMHDVMVALYHPLCGVSPITACGLAAVQGLKVQEHATLFSQNGGLPGGTLTFPGTLAPEVAQSLETKWNTNYGGENAGRVAVLTNGLEYKPLQMISAVDAQLIEQLKWTAENVCTAFLVPPHMIGVTPPPPQNNVEALWQQFYALCLQNKIEKVELLQDEGLGLDKATGKRLGTRFDLNDLLRMDSATQYKTYGEGVRGGLLAPNEGRKLLNYPPVPGGDSPYLQHQDYSLAALAKRDAKPDPFANTPTAEAPSGADEPLTEARTRAAMVKAMAA